jgi:hypothetical protein
MIGLEGGLMAIAEPTPKTIAVGVLTPSVDIYETFRLDEPVEAILTWVLDAIAYAKYRGEFELQYDGQPLELGSAISQYVDRFQWTDGTLLRLVNRVTQRSE